MFPLRASKFLTRQKPYYLQSPVNLVRHLFKEFQLYPNFFNLGIFWGWESSRSRGPCIFQLKFSRYWRISLLTFRGCKKPDFSNCIIQNLWREVFHWFALEALEPENMRNLFTSDYIIADLVFMLFQWRFTKALFLFSDFAIHTIRTIE